MLLRHGRLPPPARRDGGRPAAAGPRSAGRRRSMRTVATPDSNSSGARPEPLRPARRPSGGSTATSRRPRYAPMVISPAGGPPPLVAVVGPTATGKSGLGVALAAALDGEVVNADAMALYRGMDVGTAKLAPAERGGVPHHLLDVLDVTETASVAAYQRAARAKVEELRAAGRTPVLVGGSGLYVQAVLDELEFPGTDARLRAELEAELAVVGPAVLHTRLAAVDPAAAAAVLPSNGRRIVRALEVVTLTGRPFPARLATGGPPRYDAVLLGVDRPTPELDERVARRVARMFADGLVAETRDLLDRGLRDGRTASRALGYQQVVAALDGSVPFCRATSLRPPSRRCAPRGGSSAGSARGSAATAGSCGSTPARTCPSEHFVRWVHDVHDRDPVQQGPRHGERLRRPARPRRRARPDRRPGRGALRPPPRARRGRGAAGGPLGRAQGRRVPGRAGRRVVHGLPQRGRQRRRDVRQRRAGLRPLARPRRVAARRWPAAARHPGRGPRGALHPPTGSPSTWARRASARPRPPSWADGRSPGRRWTSATRTWPASPTSRWTSWT